MALPTDRSPTDPADDPAAHAADHNTMAGQYNSYEGTTPADFADVYHGHPYSGWPYAFLSATTFTDPGSGNLKFNSATLASITRVYIHDNDVLARSHATIINTWDDSTSGTIRGFLTFLATDGDYLILRVSGAVFDQGTWNEVTVVFVESSGTFTNTEAVYVSFDSTADVVSHEAAADPHTGYLKESVISGLATPAIILGSAAAAGSTLTPIRSDATIAAFDATAPTTVAFGAAAATGSVAFAARRDHTHGAPADPVTAHAAAADPHTGYLKESVISGLATPAIILGSAAAAGSTLTPIRSDATIAAFDATNPTTSLVGDAAAVGTAAFAARRDHKHAREAASTLGTLGYTQTTSNQTFTAETTLVSAAVTVGSGRRIKVTGDFGRPSHGTAGSTGIYRIKESTTLLNRKDLAVVAAGNGAGVNFCVVLTPTSGAHTYSITAECASASNTNAGAGQPVFILVEDIGV